ncbi:MAG: tetratricopeptide repeat protein [Lewinellaceae bacterium]|nr:tetratricopeptide repeat protein [Saprospiraceae bacterium]MCB9344759.1 tetratricopeptide repeat protein [Lewinellaceae bacterium]
MSKQSRKANTKKSARNQSATPAATGSASFQLPAFIRNISLQSRLIFAFAFLLYANTLQHGFVLDDAIVITDNMYTQEGIKGINGILSKDTFFGFFKVEGKETLVSGGRYRPMTLVFFAILYQMVGAAPFVFHLLTVLLFAATCVLFYHTLLLLFGGKENDRAALISWLAAVLFAAHPIHTEVVANIKGCDEIVTMLGSLAALFFTVKAYDTGSKKWTILAGITFFFACLSKENAAAFVILIPMALWFFRGGSSAEKANKPSVLAASVPIFIAFALFFFLRGSILHWRFGGAPLELMNNPFLKIEGTQWVPFAPAEKLATIFYTLWKYIQLLFIPHPLTHDYYPRQIGLITFANPLALLSVAVYAFLGYYAIKGTQKRNPLAFGIWLYLLPLGIVSNIVFPIGTNMGERFAFMPSLGFCLIIAILLANLFPKNRNLVLGLFGIAIALFSLKTVTRNTVWASNETLFLSDAETSFNSAKLQNACGGVLFDKATKEETLDKQKELCSRALKHLDQAVKIYPNYKDAYISRGGCQFVLQNYDAAIADYRTAIKLVPDEPKYKGYLALALRDGGKFQGEKQNNLAKALTYLTESWQYNNKDPETARLLGVCYGVQGKHADAIMWFGKAVELQPDNATYLWDLGLAYSASGNLAKGEEIRQQALKIDPTIMETRGGKK